MRKLLLPFFNRRNPSNGRVTVSYSKCHERPSLVIITYCAITFNIYVGLEGLGPIKIGPVRYGIEH